jgi:signal transduction histidine kinase
MAAEIRASLQQTNSRPVDLAAALERVHSTAPEALGVFAMALDGRVVSSSSPQRAGESRANSPYFEQGRRSFCPGDIIRDDTGELRWIMSAPVKDTRTGQPLGVVALSVSPEALSRLTTGRRDLEEGSDTQSFRIGRTGETYLVNRNGLMLTESRFLTNAILRVKVDNEPVRAAMQRGQETLGDYLDYRGILVSGASAILCKRGWVLITEIDFSQAFAPIRRLRNVLIGVAIGVALAAALGARRLARGIVDPLRLLSAADRALASNDKPAAFVPEHGLPADEIGDFARKRNLRVKQLIEHQEALLREQAERAEAAAELERISYSMVHDMRAPLRAIISLGDLLNAEASERLTESERRYIERMRTSSLRMDRLICDLLKYSSLLRADVALSPVDVAQLLRRLISDTPDFQAHASDIDVDAAIPAVRASELLLNQCFSALLDNALKYGRPGVRPKIRIHAERTPQWVKISVEDNGMGMPVEFQKRVFQLFQKGTNSSQGTGLGLALLRVAIKRMGGQVGVASEDGAGSCFWLELKSAESPCLTSNA